MFIAALFTITKTWIQDGQMDKENVVYVYNRIAFSHKKEGNPAIRDNTDFESIMLSEVSQTEKDK